MHRFIKGMAVVLLWISALGGTVLVVLGVVGLDSGVPAKRVEGKLLLVYGAVGGLIGALQAALVWAAGRGLEILEQASRYYYSQSRALEVQARANRALLERIAERLDGAPAMPGGHDTPIEEIPPAPPPDERFKPMTPEEAERWFQQGK